MKKLCYAIPIKSYASVYGNLSASAINMQEYCLPNDIALLALFTKKILNITAIEFENNEISIGNDCVIAGYPKKPYSIGYICPIARKDEYRLIKQAFHHFKNLVFASGKIEGISQDSIDVSCSTTNGMSGSPTFTAEGKVCGIYVGGPPLPGQRQLLKICHCLLKDDYLKAFSLAKSLKTLDLYYRVSLFSLYSIILKTL